MSVQGSLKTMGIPELLMWISHFQKSGVLRIDLDSSSRLLGFDRGSLTYSASSDEKETLGRILIEKGIITEEMHERARKLRTEKAVAVAKGLRDLGLIPEGEVVRYLRKKAEKEIFEMFHEIEGSFSFDEELGLVLDLLPLKLNVSSLVLRITQQLDEKDEYDFDSSGVHLQIPKDI